MNRKGAKTVISIVDDDVALGASIKELLKSVGLVANVFTSAQAFLLSKWLAKTSCLVSDIKMPGMGGLELHRQLVAKGHHIPVIFMSAFDDEIVRKATEKAGAIGFLTKPLSEDDFLGCVRAAISTNRG
jgi:FixJ family two-component response regulator